MLDCVVKNMERETSGTLGCKGRTQNALEQPHAETDLKTSSSSHSSIC